MKKLKADLEEIAMFMDNQDRYDQNYYLDTETGETVTTPEELMRSLKDGESLEDLPAWELELVDVAREILAESPRYVEIPMRPSYEGYDLMIEFAEGVKDPKLQRDLQYALRGKGAFRRFKDRLRDYPDVEKEWFAFRDAGDRGYVKEWLESIGIEAIA